MTPNGNGQTQLTETGFNYSPAWSPDGAEIAFVSERDGNPEIYVMGADGSNETRVTNNDWGDEMPAWSPDGSKIAFAGYRGVSFDIWVMNADGSGETNLTNHPSHDLNPAWRPDGAAIAFDTNRDGNDEIYLIGIDGTGLTNLTLSPSRQDSDPNWSPDGARIAFTDTLNIWIMNSNGSGQTQIQKAGVEEKPAWSPDGSRIVFVIGGAASEEIWTMNANGTASVRLTTNAVLDSRPDWQPTELINPVCDLRLALLGQPHADGVTAGIGQEIGVHGFGYPADATVAILFQGPSGQFPDAAQADGQGAFAFGVYFTPGSEGAWSITGSVATQPGCTDLVSVTVVTGHPFVDIGGHPFEAEIAWLYQSGITGGCAATRFCPNASVTRGQMASFLVRALGLPTTSDDFFLDDETSIHESNINRLAASGITGGCAPNRFCPTAQVTREQMASFLVRAFELPTTGEDFFIDDETSIHESNINRLAASGISGGCAANKYCPKAIVTRAQMAAFLERALFSVGTSSSAATHTEDTGLESRPQRLRIGSR